MFLTTTSQESTFTPKEGIRLLKTPSGAITTMKSIFKASITHTVAVLAGALLIGGGSLAFAAGGGADPTPPIVIDQPADVVDNGGYPDLNLTACATAPTIKAKFQVFQDVNYGFTGANDRLRLGNNYESWSNDPSPTYLSTIEVERRAGTNTFVTDVQVCTVTIKQTMTDMDPTNMYPVYTYELVDAHWESLYTSKSGKRSVSVPQPQYDTADDPTSSSYSYTFVAAMLVGGRGSGTSTSTYIVPMYPGGGK